MTHAPSTSANQVSPEEWQQRVDLAAAYRLVAHFHWDDLVFTHISARVPGPDHHFLINPYGMLFEEITASSLVKVDLARPQGRWTRRTTINPAGFVIHSAIHAAREDAQVRPPRPQPERRRRLGAEGRAAADLAAVHLRPLVARLPRLRGRRAPRRREAAARARPRRQALPHAPQPRPAHRRGEHPRRVPPPVPVRDRVHDPGARAGRRRGARPHRSAHHRHGARSRARGHARPGARSRGRGSCASSIASMRVIGADREPGPPGAELRARARTSPRPASEAARSRRARGPGSTSGRPRG